MALLSFARRNDPMDALLRLQDQLERAFDGAPGFPFGVSGRGVHPPVNVFRDENGYALTLEAPGFEAENISIESVGQTLKLSGKRETQEPAEASYHRRECWRGEFSRALQLPADADLGKTEASMRNGLLRIHVPLKEETRPRQIEVTAS